jgi:hypothetical protein
MRSRGEIYSPEAALSTEPRCVIDGCAEPVVAEVHSDDYADALATFRGIRRKEIRIRRAGDERLFACEHHLKHDERMRRLLWQQLLFHS